MASFTRDDREALEAISMLKGMFNRQGVSEDMLIEKIDRTMEAMGWYFTFGHWKNKFKELDKKLSRGKRNEIKKKSINREEEREAIEAAV